MTVAFNRLYVGACVCITGAVAMITHLGYALFYPDPPVWMLMVSLLVTVTGAIMVTVEDGLPVARPRPYGIRQPERLPVATWNSFDDFWMQKHGFNFQDDPPADSQ